MDHFMCFFPPRLWKEVCLDEKNQKQCRWADDSHNSYKLWIDIIKSVTVRNSNLSGGAKVGRRTAGAGVRQGGASAAAYRGGWSGTGRRIGDVGRLTQNAMPLETSPRWAPAEEELIQQLNLEGEPSRDKQRTLVPRLDLYFVIMVENNYKDSLPAKQFLVSLFGGKKHSFWSEDCLSLCCVISLFNSTCSETENILNMYHSVFPTTFYTLKHIVCQLSASKDNPNIPQVVKTKFKCIFFFAKVWLKQLHWGVLM